MTNQNMLCAESARRKYFYLALSFLLPFLVMGGVFALHKVSPFGDRQIMLSDYWHQYFPFMSDYWHKMREGTSLLWTWTYSGDFLGDIAYYLASPMNLLAILAPHEWLREAQALGVVLKVGFAGLFLAMYLRYAYGESGPHVPFFALLYGMCAFAQGYYWCLMWLDTFALLPLVMLGLTALFREGKFLLYTISLALSIFFNYFIGLFTCIFSAMMFLSLCVIHLPRGRELFRRFALFAVSSLIGAGLTALLSFPAYSSLQNTFSIDSQFPSSVLFFKSSIDVLGNMIAFVPASSADGLPNIYSGMISVLLASVFVCSAKINLREKIVWLYMVIFLVLSCNINVLDYIWHGFHYTSMVPFRFSFLVSFTLAVMACRAYRLMEEIDWWDLIIMAGAAALFLTSAGIGPQTRDSVMGSAVLCALYLLIFALSVGRRVSVRRWLNAALLLIVAAEISGTFYLSVKTNGTTDRPSYPSKYEQSQRLLDMREPAGTDFYRTEFADYYTVNDPSLYGFNGLSLFSSSVNANVSKFIERIGLPAWVEGNRYGYLETSPLANAFLNMRYLISRSGSPSDGEVYWNQVASADGALLLENARYLPLGFMVGEETSGYAYNDKNIFLSQNDLFSRATGISADLFTAFSADRAGHDNYTVSADSGGYSYTLTDKEKNGSLKWYFKAPSDGMIYGYCKIDNTRTATLTFKNTNLRTVDVSRAFIFTVGKFAKGETIAISFNPEVKDADGKMVKAQQGRAVIYMAHLDGELFDRGYAALADEKLNLTKFTETEVAGHVTAKSDGLLYTSIPHADRWAAFVDGVESEVTLIDNCMTAVKVKEGEHTVEFRYRNKALTAGLIVSALSLLSLAALLVFSSVWKREEEETPGAAESE